MAQQHAVSVRIERLEHRASEQRRPIVPLGLGGLLAVVGLGRGLLLSEAELGQDSWRGGRLPLLLLFPPPLQGLQTLLS